MVKKKEDEKSGGVSGLLYFWKSVLKACSKRFASRFLKSLCFDLLCFVCLAVIVVVAYAGLWLSAASLSNVMPLAVSSAFAIANDPSAASLYSDQLKTVNAGLDSFFASIVIISIAALFVMVACFAQFQKIVFDVVARAGSSGVFWRFFVCTLAIFIALLAGSAFSLLVFRKPLNAILFFAFISFLALVTNNLFFTLRTEKSAKWSVGKAFSLIDRRTLLIFLVFIIAANLVGSVIAWGLSLVSVVLAVVFLLLFFFCCVSLGRMLIYHADEVIMGNG